MGLFRAAGVLVLVSVAGACSSGGGGGSGGGRTGTCSSFCAKAIAEGCETDAPADCEASCEVSVADNPEACRPYQLGGMICVLEAFGCDYSNVTGVGVVQACPGEIAAYGGCAACSAEADDDACDTCSKTSCCAERKTAYGDLETVKFAVCFSECVDSGCAESCTDQYPGAMSKIQALANCESASCPGC